MEIGARIRLDSVNWQCYYCYRFLCSLSSARRIGILSSDNTRSSGGLSIAKKFRDKKTMIKSIIAVACIIAWFGFSINPAVAFDNNPVGLWVNCPNDGQAGVEFTCTIEAWDWSERISSSYTATVSFSLESYNSTDLSMMDQSSISKTLPADTSFSGAAIDMGGIPASWLKGKDYGKKEFAITIDTPGIHYVKVEDDIGLVGYSNPILITAEAPEMQLLWGDLHTHSIMSDGSGLPEETTAYARDEALLDFYALVDHGEMTLSTRPQPDWIRRWDSRVINENNDPGDFVTFQGSEWTTKYGFQGELGFGHYAVISDGAVPLYVARTIQTTPDQLWDYLDEYCAENDADCLAIPHHLTQTNFEMDWAGMNPKYVKTAEIFSVHGASLLQPDDPKNHLGIVHYHHTPTPGASAADALTMGHRIAFMADSDTHDGHPGHALSHLGAHYPNQWPLSITGNRAGHPYPGGLTGAWASEFTREGILGAVRNGSCLGTRAPYRPIINFTVNGVKNGENNSTVKVATSTTSRTIELTVMRDGLERNGGNWQDLTVELWKNSELFDTTTVAGAVSRLEWVDGSSITGTSYDDCVQDADGN